ncbi:Wadjet anti-phage system protein JetD domain-containing protein [Pseudomaricurvus sp. HS19]|uniref:Wadjet anti-phage system protein JetD domain-containing protein n=1 Tax=Pseudomaricurvus sp. HS19 TaxID=2692626 RepID=UPI00136C0173|nr:Wadjet anti-phage system protein JetD domain-containing protein [Pseudomaricurvus sp. HS19]MYM62521.1 hypothetical protein [Pseudomaricurvus sp. HS19]
MTSQPPKWLPDQPDIDGLLRRFVRKLDKGTEISSLQAVSLTESNARWLYLHPDSDFSWQCLRELHQEFRLLTLLPKAKGERLEELPPVSGVKVKVRSDGQQEATLRDWLQMPRVSLQQVEWEAAVLSHREVFPGAIEDLLRRPLSLDGWSSDQVVIELGKISAILSGPMTLRRLSTQLFQRDSKFLERKFPVSRLRLLFPDIEELILPRRLNVQVHLPTDFDHILFVENWDSFCWLAEQAFSDARRSALVYSQGFKLTSDRARNRDAVWFSYSGGSKEESCVHFERYWFGGGSVFPCFFWGDLDYAGMQILKSLRATFPETRAWQPGYQKLLAVLDEGHEPTIANKEGQREILATGCEFADTVLLPALARSQRFVDQEWLIEDV